MKTTVQERAERLFKSQEDGKVAMAEYREQEMVRARTMARLRAERLARDAKLKGKKADD